ncbi:F-box and FNIP repeat-containing protein [Bandra megavirus]|uniref:F-box and FNIP repeat-containing protein n=1 Tax=Bandra megavirus TaxID=2071566 RepID=A0A2K9V9M7_9VIRU|nr:F-box and FNIP repeat-containing protein [Bandra megavirus]
MTNLTNYLCYELIMMIFDLLPDKDKIQFSMANKYLTSFVPNIIWTNMYQYEKIRFLPYKNNFRKLSFKPRYDIIPPVITHLIIDKEFVGSLTNVIPKSVKKIYIDKDSRVKHSAYIPKNIEVFCKCEFDKKYYPNKVSSLMFLCCPTYTKIIDCVGNIYSTNLCTELYGNYYSTELYDNFVNFNNMFVKNGELFFESDYGDYYERLMSIERDFKYTSPETELALYILTSPKPIAQTERLCPEIQSIQKSKSKSKAKHKQIYPNHAQQKIPKRIMMPKQKFSKYRR